MRVDIGLVAAVLESYPLNVTNHCDLTRGGRVQYSKTEHPFSAHSKYVYTVPSEPNNLPLETINNVEPVTFDLIDLTQVVQHYIKVGLHNRLPNYVCNRNLYNLCLHLRINVRGHGGGDSGVIAFRLLR